jgi:hypothetical protein
MGDRSELLRLLGNTERLRPPTPVATRTGKWRRDPAGEWDWYYQLDDGLQSWIRRHAMANVGHGCLPDDLADLTGYGYVNEWAEAFVSACQVARDSADHWGEYAAPDDDELLGPDEFAHLLQVSRGAVRQWRKRGLLPAAAFELSGMPIWTLGEIRQWACDTGRTIEGENAA